MPLSFKKLSVEHQEATSQANAAKEELRQAAEIAVGKPYLLQCIFDSRAFPELTQNWRISGAYSDLRWSVEDVCQHCGGR